MKNYPRQQNDWRLVILALLLTLGFSRFFSSATWLAVVLWNFFWLLIFGQVLVFRDIFFLRRFVFIFLAIVFLLGFRLFLIDYNQLLLACPLAASTGLGIKIRTVFSVGKFFYLFLVPLIFLLLILWLGLRWCSFACFWGGWNELFATISGGKAIIKLRNPGYFRELPVALSLFFNIVILTGGGLLFCLVLCPFKLTSISTAAISVGWLKHLWVLVLILAVIILPLLTKKHFFCRFLCPLKGLISLLGRSGWQVAINERCDNCQLCLQSCPEMAIVQSSSGIRIDQSYCTRCLLCRSICPVQAIEVSFSPGKLLTEEQLRREVLFTLTFSAIINSFWGPAAFQHLLGLK